jgi:4-amino-4-deoxy-L-arabinose transferase-like glycosyltransferase
VRDACQRPWHTAATLGAFAIVIAVIPVLRFPFGGDEKALYDAGSILADQGWKDFLRQYPQTSGVGDRHPMLVPILAGIGQLLFGDNPFGARLLFLSFLAGSTALTYVIGKRLCDAVTGFQAALLFLSLRLVLFMGIRVSTDLPVTFFALLAIFFTLRLREVPAIRLGAMVGAALALGFLSKYTMGLILPFLGYIMVRGRKRPTWVYIASAAGLFAALLGVWIGVLYMTGAFGEQLRTVGSHLGWNDGSVNLLSSWRMQFRLKAILIQIPSALGAYTLPILALGGWETSRQWTGSERLLAIWIGTVFLLLLLTLPVDRYFLPAFPALAIVGAAGLQPMKESAWRLLLLALLFSVGTAMLYA